MRFTLPAIFTALLFSFPAHSQVQKIKSIAGTGTAGFGGDGSVSTAALLHSPREVKLDGSGNVYILDYTNFRIRRINAAGNMVTIAGNGVIGNSGDGSVSTSAAMWPTGIALDKYNTLHISDGHSFVIRKVNSMGIISTIAGTGLFGNNGNSGPAVLASVGMVQGMAFDTANNMYFADASNHVVRKIDAAGMISRFAGDDTAGYMGDDGPAITARLDSPFAVATDYKGNVYISDLKANVIRKVNAAGIITTFAGDGSFGYAGDGGPAVAASLNRPAGMAVDMNGFVYVADADNDVIRMIDTFGVITTVVGNGTPGFGGDLGYVNGCNLHTPFGLAVAANGDLYIADANNQRIRQTYASVSVANVSTSNEISVSPNPASDRWYVSGISKGDIACIYDLTGRLLSKLNATGNSIDIHCTSLASGVYMLRVSDATGAGKSLVRVVKD